jgi:hypothetical protein
MFERVEVTVQKPNGQREKIYFNEFNWNKHQWDMLVRNPADYKHHTIIEIKQGDKIKPTSWRPFGVDVLSDDI